MRIKTFWWGAEFFADNSEEFKRMLHVFEGATVTSTYESPKHETVEVDHELQCVSIAR